MSVRVRALIAAIVMLVPGLVAGGEPRLREHRTEAENRGWEAVGRLNLGERGFCTASLVTSDVVLTAAHCLFDEDGERIASEEIEFHAGLRHGEADARRGVRRIVLHPDYDVHAVSRLPRVGNDLALVELDRPVRKGRVTPFRTMPGIGEGTRVHVLSYAKDRSEAPSREEACEVLDRDADVLVLSCSVDFGASGAPVFVDAPGGLRVVSVISAKAMWRGREVALAAVMEGELDRLLTAFSLTPAHAPVGDRLASVSVPGSIVE
jgi:V8-like Glu-specific endopeptidase